jgi:TolA-binding protein
MKKIILSTILGASVLLSSCGKKITASFSGSNQEQAYHVNKKTNATKTETNTDAVAPNPVSPVVSSNEVVEAKDAKDNNISKTELKQKISSARETIQNMDKSQLNEKQQKMMKKLDHKLEKMEKKGPLQKNGSLSKLLIIGIILLVVGAILWGVGGPLWILGLIAVIIGLVLVLIELLKMA